jgi:hypothetical protein
VWLNWLDLFERCDELRATLRAILYDDACHLKVSPCQRLEHSCLFMLSLTLPLSAPEQKFSQNRCELSTRARLFAELLLACDAMHFKNHSNSEATAVNKTWAKFCREECDPEIHEITRMANTEVCEQVLFCACFAHVRFYV